MIYQTNGEETLEFNHVGCLYDDHAYARELYLGKPWAAQELKKSWVDAIAKGIVSGDLNHNGRLGDDPNELLIQNWDDLAKHTGSPLKFFGQFPPGAPEKTGRYIIARWFNPNTGFRHFVVGDEKPPVWDPIEGGSRTVREGHIEFLFLFDIVLSSKV